MRILVPYHDSGLGHHALHEACRIMTPLDDVVVMATVIVPSSLPVDVPPGEVWKQTCRAEVQLAQARTLAARFGCDGPEMCFVRIQAADPLAAVLAAAIWYAADTILLAGYAGVRGRLAAFFDPSAAVIRHAPCDVRVVYMRQHSGTSDRICTRQERRPFIESLSSPHSPTPSQPGYDVPSPSPGHDRPRMWRWARNSCAGALHND